MDVMNPKMELTGKSSAVDSAVPFAVYKILTGNLDAAGVE